MKKQSALVKAIIDDFCPRFVSGGIIVHLGNAEKSAAHFEAAYLAELGVSVEDAAEMPSVVIHCARRNWLFLIEAVPNTGPVDGKRRKELQELFADSTASLIYFTAFETRRAMQSFVLQIAWESDVWIAEDPAHLIHFNGDKLAGPYEDALPRIA